VLIAAVMIRGPLWLALLPVSMLDNPESRPAQCQPRGGARFPAGGFFGGRMIWPAVVQ